MLNSKGSRSSNQADRSNHHPHEVEPSRIKSSPAKSLPSPSSLASLSALEAMLFLHRGDAAVVTLHRKHCGQWQELGGIPVSKLSEQLPQIHQHLRFDSYFTI